MGARVSACPELVEPALPVRPIPSADRLLRHSGFDALIAEHGRAQTLEAIAEAL